MPTRGFSTNALNAAAPGLSRLAMAIGGGGQVRQQAADDANLTQSRIAQALANVQQSEAAAGKYDADAAQQRAETANLARRPDQQMELAAYSSGQSLPLLRSFMEATRNGSTPTIPGQFLDGPNPDGSAGVAARIPDEIQSKIAQALVRMAPVGLNQKDIGAGDWAKSLDVYRDQDLSDRAIANPTQAGAIGRGQAAAAGKALYNADATGSVLDLFGGGLDTSNPMAQGSIALKKDQAGAQRANAVQSYAAADNSRASAVKTREETKQLGQGGVKAPTGYAWGDVDPASGMRTLTPIKGGPADNAAPKPPPGEVRRMNIALRALSTGLDEYEKLIADLDPRSPRTQADPKIRAKAQALMGDLQLQYKEAQALGALTGPDLEVLGRVLTDPMTLRGAMYGQGGLKQQLSEARGGLRRRSQALADEFGTQPIPVNGGGPAVGAVENGYRFKGGNPADQGAWEKVQ